MRTYLEKRLKRTSTLLVNLFDKNFGIKYKNLKIKYHLHPGYFPNIHKPHIFPYYLRITVIKIQCASDSLGGLIKTQISVPTPQIPDPVDLGLGPIICISSKLPDGSNIVGPESQFENQCLVAQLLTSERSLRL